MRKLPELVLIGTLAALAIGGPSIAAAQDQPQPIVQPQGGVFAPPADEELRSIDSEAQIVTILYATCVPLTLAAGAATALGWAGFNSDRFTPGGAGGWSAFMVVMGAVAIAAGLGSFIALGLDLDNTSRRRSWQEQRQAARLRLGPGPGELGLGVGVSFF